MCGTGLDGKLERKIAALKVKSAKAARAVLPSLPTKAQSKPADIAEAKPIAESNPPRSTN